LDENSLGNRTLGNHTFTLIFCFLLQRERERERERGGGGSYRDLVGRPDGKMPSWKT